MPHPSRPSRAHATADSHAAGVARAMLYLCCMKPILFIAFLALGPAIGAQVTPTVAMPEAAHVVVGDVE